MDEEKKQGSGKKWLFGCCGGLVVLAILCAGGSFLGAGWAKDKAATAVREALAESLERADLSPEQTAGINGQAERLEQAIKSWGVGEAIGHLQALEGLGDELEDIGPHAALLGYAAGILPNTDMPEEERATARRTLQRFARGLDEGKLSFNESDRSWNLKVSSEDDEQAKFNVEEVRAHLADLKAQVEAAGIPDEAYEVDLTQKLKTIVDALIDG